jgi:hypothetical protein
MRTSPRPHNLRKVDNAAASSPIIIAGSLFTNVGSAAAVPTLMAWQKQTSAGRTLQAK